ncbi:hypothetical protein [Desulfoplanes sp.]
MRRNREIVAFLLIFCFAVLLGMALVWVNIERVDLSYGLQKMQATLSQKEELSSKLEVERNNLVAPARLRHAAQEAGLYAADSGQMRKITGAQTTQPPRD